MKEDPVSPRLPTTDAPRLGVIGGGANSEHDVSIASAGSIVRASADRYRILSLAIGENGRWYDAMGELLDFDVVVRMLQSCDVVFPAVHGQNGEDGMLAAFLTTIGVPFVGSELAAGAIAMNKWTTKLIAWDLGIDVAVGVLVDEGYPEGRPPLPPLPIVVKPVSGGSSHGVSVVRTPNVLELALDAAFRHDSRVLVEEFVTGREIDIAVLERHDGTLLVSPPLEVCLDHDLIFDTQRKYGGEAEFILPAVLEQEHLDEIRRVAVRLFRALGCAGVARFDFFLTSEGLMLNEVNTMPGFTPQSQVPMMFDAIGLSYRKLIDELVASALARRRK